MQFSKLLPQSARQIILQVTEAKLNKFLDQFRASEDHTGRYPVQLLAVAAAATDSIFHSGYSMKHKASDGSQSVISPLCLDHCGSAPR